MKSIRPQIIILLAVLAASGCLMLPGTPRAGQTRILDLDEGVTMSFVWCPPGEFVMGGENERQLVFWSDPIPEYKYKGGYVSTDPDVLFHRVCLTKGFWVGQYEVTWRQWKRLYGETEKIKYWKEVFASQRRTYDEEEPVMPVQWREAVAFCEKLNELMNKTEIGWAKASRAMSGRFRLPTEAEWEYACRASTRGPYNFKGEINPNKVNYNANCRPPPPRHPVKVGSYPPNAWGLYDMHGNAREWVQDWYAPYPAEGTVTNPVGPVIEGCDPDNFYEEDKGWKVTRGGAFYDADFVCTSFRRHKSSNMVGMRVIFEPTDQLTGKRSPVPAANRKAQAMGALVQPE